MDEEKLESRKSQDRLYTPLAELLLMESEAL